MPDQRTIIALSQALLSLTREHFNYAGKPFTDAELLMFMEEAMDFLKLNCPASNATSMQFPLTDREAFAIRRLTSLAWKQLQAEPANTAKIRSFIRAANAVSGASPEQPCTVEHYRIFMNGFSAYHAGLPEPLLAHLRTALTKMVTAYPFTSPNPALHVWPAPAQS